MENRDHTAPERRLVAQVLLPIFTGITGLLLPFVFEKWWETNMSLTVALVLALILGFIIVGMQFLTLQHTMRIGSQVGLVVHFHRADASNEIYEEARRVIARATKSIHALNSSLVEESGKHALSSGKKKAYYEELLGKANSGVEYKRLLQAEDPIQYARVLEDDDPVAFAHLVQMQSALPHELGGCTVKYCIPTRFTNFVLVDDVHLIWQISEISLSGDGERSKLIGAFVFDDPQSLITRHFKKYFRDMDKSSMPVPTLVPRKKSASAKGGLNPEGELGA